MAKVQGAECCDRSALACLLSLTLVAMGDGE